MHIGRFDLFFSHFSKSYCTNSENIFNICFYAVQVKPIAVFRSYLINLIANYECLEQFFIIPWVILKPYLPKCNFTGLVTKLNAVPCKIAFTKFLALIPSSSLMFISSHGQRRRTLKFQI